MSRMRVYLDEQYRDIEEGFFFGVNIDLLWETRDAAYKQYKDMIKVFNESDNEYWIYQEDLDNINDIIAEL